jgi:condensin-2 complex subunit G2
MFHAIHAQPMGGLAGVLLRVLDGFHLKKKEAGVDAMLLRLYEPLLWRALKAANAVVRANAVALLCAAFPLQDSSQPRAAADALIQQQFEAMREAITDPSPGVRAVAAEGVARVLALFWELIPSATAAGFVNELVSKLVRDTTAAPVRIAALRGLTFLLDLPLAQSLLRPLLPSLKNCIHDSAERVRRAMVELLLAVKNINDLPYWEIVPVEHLLTRLELEPRETARLLTELLAPSCVIRSFYRYVGWLIIFVAAPQVFPGQSGQRGASSSRTPSYLRKSGRRPSILFASPPCRRGK